MGPMFLSGHVFGCTGYMAQCVSRKGVNGGCMTCQNTHEKGGDPHMQIDQDASMMRKTLDKRGNASLWPQVRKHYQIYLILIPAVVYYLVFHYLPMVGLTMAFREYKFNLGFIGSPWVGFKYFVAFFNFYDFWNILRNTVVISFFKLIVFFPFPIIFALMLTEVRSKIFKVVVQTASYLPHFVSWVVAVVVFQRFLSLDGLVNQVRMLLGHDVVFYMNDKEFFYPIMFFSHMWKTLGYSSIIYFAALSNVDMELYEAARIDGAGRLRQIIHISIPSIAPTIIMLFILSLANVLNAGWDQIYLLQSPGNASLSNIIDTYVIFEGFKRAQFGYATAVSLFQSVLGLVMVLMTNKVAKKISDIGIF